MEEDERVHVHRCGVVVALVVLLAFAGASCGQKTRPEGLIAFSHGVEDDVVVLSLADGRIHRVTSARRGQFDPSWSPDRKQLVFPDSRAGVNRNDEIYVIKADGSGARNLTHESANDWSPAWSPDGQTIVFASERSGQLALWAMRPDGSHVGQLTDGVDEYPAWSPDSRRIAFGRGLPLSDIWVADRDGSRERQLTSDPDPEWLPAWSPDGRKIAYVRGFEGHGTIWVMGADGSGQRQLTQGYDDMAPDWSADGEWLVFSRRGTLYTMRKDGEQVRSLQVEGLLPDWAPILE
jgi:TolB protein